MSATYGLAIDALEAELARVKEVQVKLEQALTVMRGLHSDSERPAPVARDGKPGPKPKTAENDRMRLQYESGVPVARIAKAFRVSDQTVYGRANKHKWHRPPGPGVKKRAHGPAIEIGRGNTSPKGERLAGRVRCTSKECGVWTDYDPCEKCGKTLKRPGV